MFTRELYTEKALEHQNQQNWADALAVYQAMDPSWLDTADIKLQIANCLFKLGRYADALQFALQSAKLSPDTWQAHHLSALSLRMTGRLPEALKLLSMLFRRHPDIAEIRYDYGDFVCKALGDWSTAHKIWAPLQYKAKYKPAMNWFAIKEQIYDGTTSNKKLTDEIITFSRNHLHLPERGTPRQPCSPQRKRLKVGLISTFFRATPVYYLCFAALKNISTEFDLIFYSRETIDDWATDEFKSIAYNWQSVKHLSAEQLSLHLHCEKLDVIIDMCGWLDKNVLKALSTKPARRMYKWVGGQSSTTGMNCFDGFITDLHQSPPQLQPYYTEPLLFIDSGYATYNAPVYLPPPQQPLNSGRWQAGVISHPMKVSMPFLTYLRQQMVDLEEKADFLVNLKFIGWRYGQPVLQKHILRIFQPVFDKASKWLSIEFVTTKNHKDFLDKVSKLDWVIDTFPYTSGVTALESLALGVPCRTKVGTLFSQRHAYSHCRYANLAQDTFDLDSLGPFRPPLQPKSGLTLLPDDCARMNHAGLASSLAGILS